jgi:hypothetical protein
VLSLESCANPPKAFFRRLRMQGNCVAAYVAFATDGSFQKFSFFEKLHVRL